MSEHPIDQTIRSIELPDGGGGFTVGSNCTSIEACTKSGMHADIPYVRVWQDEVALAEFCQHQIVGVWFALPPTL